MQVAKYWRNNQLRYRLQGVIQQKVEVTTSAHPVQVSDKEEQQSVESPEKVKVA